MKWRVIDLFNKIIYFNNAPKFAQVIYVKQKDINLFYKCKEVNGTGKVISGDWDLTLEYSEDAEIKYRFCKMHWNEGIPWENTGIYAYILERINLFGQYDNLQNLSEVKTRYKELDKIFNEVKETRCLRTQKQVNPNNFREVGGIVVHIDRYNKPIWHSNGTHRLIIARLLNIHQIPVQLGVVHKRAIKRWKDSYEHN